MNGCFYERRVGDGLGGPTGLLNGRRAGHMDGDQLCRTFTAPDDVDGELAANGPEGGQERVVARVVHLSATCAVGQEHHAIVGRAFPVDRDGVERVVHCLAQRAIEQRLSH